MGLRSRLAGLFRWAATSIDPVHPRDPALAKMFGLGATTASGVQIDERKVLGYPAVMRGVSILANAVAKVRPRIYERIGDADKRRANHVHQRYVAGWPCPEMSGYAFRQTLQHYAMLWGNGCAYVYRDGRGQIVPELGMVPLPPDTTRLVRIKAGEIERDVDAGSGGELMYVTKVGEEWRRLLPENVLHVHGLGYSGLWGYSVVDVLRETFGLGLAAREFGARFFGQGSVSSGYVTYPEGLDEEAEERWRQEIRMASQGLGRAHRLILLEHGSTFTPASVPPNNAQFLETRQFEVREIANAIGIQPHKLGDPSRKSYASLEQSNQEHLDDDLDPWLVVWEEAYAHACLTEREQAEDSHFVEFDRRQFLRTNLAARTSHYAVGMQWGWYSVNDVRRKESEPPIGPEGDQRFRPLNMAVLGEQPEPPAGGRIVDADETDETPDESDARAAVRVSWATLCESILARQARRICKQAEGKAATPAEFGRWLEDLHPDGDTPADVLEAAQAMVAQIRMRLERVANSAQTAAELQAGVAAIAGELLGIPTAIAAAAAARVIE